MALLRGPWALGENALVCSDGPFDRFEAAFGNYDPGRYAWHLPCPVPFEEPIPYRGYQYPFDVPTEILPANTKDALQRWLKT